MPIEMAYFIAIFPAITALAGVGVAQLIQSKRDERAHKNALELAAIADRRARRDAKLARMRKAFEPVLVAVSGVQTAAAEFFFSESGRPELDAKTILETSLSGINEARAQMWLEGEDVDDVATQVQRVFGGFAVVRREIGGRVGGRVSTATAEEIKRAFEDVNDGSAKVRERVRAHIRKVEETI